MAPTRERQQALGTAASEVDDASTTSGSGRARDYDGIPVTDLIRVGMLSCNEGHTKGLWSSLLNPQGEQIRMTGMVMTHCWDINPEVNRAFAEEYGITAVGEYTDLVGKVDAVIMGTYNSLAYNHVLARPYLEAGVPIFINRPFSTTLAAAKEMIEVARRHNTPVMCASSFEFTREVEIARERVRQAGGNLQGYSATNSMSDYSTHGVHGVYLIHRIVGGPVRAIAYRTPDWTKPNGLVTLEHEGRDGGIPFYGTLQEIGGGLTNASIRLWTGGANDFEQKLFWERGPYDRDKFMWIPMLLEMQRMFLTRTMCQSYEEIIEKTLWYLAGFRSHLEHDGGWVPLAGFDEEWEAPVMSWGRGGDFDYQKAYGKAFGE